MLYGRLVQVGETLTDLQILSCELHKNAFGGRAPPGPAGEAIALPRLPSRYKGRGGREGKERVGNNREERNMREGTMLRGREGREEKGREDDKGERVRK